MQISVWEMVNFPSPLILSDRFSERFSNNSQRGRGDVILSIFETCFEKEVGCKNSRNSRS